MGSSQGLPIWKVSARGRILPLSRFAQLTHLFARRHLPGAWTAWTFAGLSGAPPCKNRSPAGRAGFSLASGDFYVDELTATTPGVGTTVISRPSRQLPDSPAQRRESSPPRSREHATKHRTRTAYRRQAPAAASVLTVSVAAPQSFVLPGEADAPSAGRPLVRSSSQFPLPGPSDFSRVVIPRLTALRPRP